MTKLYTILLIGMLAAIGCRTASKAFKKGDYTDAVELGVKKLQKDPNDAETKNLVQQSYAYTVSDHEDRIRVLSNSKSASRFDDIYSEYAALQHLYTVIHQYPAVAQLINATDYSGYLATYGDKAAAVHEQRADQWTNEGTKEAYREAYHEFNRAMGYRPDDLDLRKKRDMAFDAAVTNVVVAPVQSYNGYQYSSYYQLQNFQRDILHTIAASVNNEFVRFYTDFDARAQQVAPDQVMELSFSRITIGRPYDKKSTREVSKEVVSKETVYKKDSVVKEYTTIKARITTTQRTLLSQGDLFITVRDPQGQIIWSDRFTGEHKWQTQFSSYTGDERALEEADKKQLGEGAHDRQPSDDEILDALISQIRSDLYYRLRNYYARYQ